MKRLQTPNSCGTTSMYNWLELHIWDTATTRHRQCHSLYSTMTNQKKWTNQWLIIHSDRAADQMHKLTANSNKTNAVFQLQLLDKLITQWTNDTHTSKVRSVRKSGTSTMLRNSCSDKMQRDFVTLLLNTVHNGQQLTDEIKSAVTVPAALPLCRLQEELANDETEQQGHNGQQQDGYHHCRVPQDARHVWRLSAVVRRHSVTSVQSSTQTNAFVLEQQTTASNSNFQTGSPVGRG